MYSKNPKEVYAALNGIEKAGDSVFRDYLKRKKFWQNLNKYS